MKIGSLLKGCSVALACLGSALPQAALAVQPPEQYVTQKQIDQSTPLPAYNTAAPATAVDVALHPDGALVGQVIDADGNPQVGAPVVVLDQGREIALTETNASGGFVVPGLRAGVFQVTAGRTTGVYRLWTQAAAPPSANQGALLIDDGQIVRGQYRSNLFSSPWTWAAIIGAAIAIPIAIEDNDDDSSS